MKQILLNNLKNVYGWKTKRKIVVISVDDYGNVRLDSKKARENMDNAGLNVKSRFDAFDTLETRQDLEILFETLISVKDVNGNSAVFTPFAMPCNINFEEMADNNYEYYSYENLPETYEKLQRKDPLAYEGAWKLWQHGINEGLMRPQFHGREHLNLKVFDEKLAQRDKEVLTALKNRSYTSISNSGYNTINYTAAFDFWEEEENNEISNILKDGITQFKNVFGFLPSVFMPPTSKIHPVHLPLLKELGISFIDINLIHNQHIGQGKYQKSYNYTGKKISKGQYNLVRNVVFEPTNNNTIDTVQLALDQIQAAFFWNRPAIISSHRVNFCGHIDLENRKIGITALKELLHKIVQRWPDVEFMSANELGNLISNKKK